MIENLKIALRKEQKLIALFLLTVFVSSGLLGFFGIRPIRNAELRAVENIQQELHATP